MIDDAAGPRTFSRVIVRATLAGLATALLLTTTAVAVPARPGTRAQEITADAGLEAALRRHVEAFPGRAGVAVVHLDSGIGASLDATTPYPMASTYKVPILVELMARVETGELSLDDEARLHPSDQHIGSGLLQDLWAPGVELSLRNLATMMIILSDNTATDMMIDRLGAAAITRRMRALGYEGIRVDRTTLELILDYLGVPYDGLEEANREEIAEALESFDPGGPEAEAAAQSFYEDGLDTATAVDMTGLLARIGRGELLSPEASEVMVEILKRTRTGAARLRGLLPNGTTVAHKTGTIGRVVNDVGIVWLPDDLGRVAISVFTLGDPDVPTERNERLIADLARTAWDFYQFQQD